MPGFGSQNPRRFHWRRRTGPRAAGNPEQLRMVSSVLLGRASTNPGWIEDSWPIFSEPSVGNSGSGDQAWDSTLGSGHCKQALHQALIHRTHGSVPQPPSAGNARLQTPPCTGPDLPFLALNPPLVQASEGPGQALGLALGSGLLIPPWTKPKSSPGSIPGSQNPQFSASTSSSWNLSPRPAEGHDLRRLAV